MFRSDHEMIHVKWPRRCIACGKQMEEGSERFSKTYDRIWIDGDNEAFSDGKRAMIEQHKKIRATLYICEECKIDTREKVSAVGAKYENREETMCKVSFSFFLFTIGLFAFQLMFPILPLLTFGMAASILTIATIVMGAIWTRIAKRAERVKILREKPPAGFLGIEVDDQGKLCFGFSSSKYAKEFKKMNPSLNTQSELNSSAL